MLIVENCIWRLYPNYRLFALLVFFLLFLLLFCPIAQAYEYIVLIDILTIFLLIFLFSKVVDCRVCGDPHSVLRFAFVEFADERKYSVLLL